MCSSDRAPIFDFLVERFRPCGEPMALSLVSDKKGRGKKGRREPGGQIVGAHGAPTEIT